MKFLIVENNERVIDILKSNLEKEFEGEVIISNNSKQALDNLSADEYDLILARNSITSEEEIDECAKVLVNYFYDRTEDTPIISLGDTDLTSDQLICLPDRFKLDELNKTVIKSLNLTAEQLQTFKLPDFVGVPVSNFFLMTKAVCDIYIKIGKDEKFVKRINQDEEVDKETILKYEEMNLREFFVKKKDYHFLLNSLLMQSINKVMTTKQKGGGTLDVQGDSFDITQNLLDTVGITEHSVRMSQATIKSIAKSIKGSGDLEKLLAELLKNKSSYSFKRSYLISAISHEILPQMGWGEGEQLVQNFEKICFVSFFHDIYLRKEELIKINNEVDAKKLSLEDCDLVMNHANKAATAVMSFPKSPQGADIIIRQHHGKANGVGFVDSPNASISPVAIFFMVVEYYVERLLELNGDEINNKDKILGVFTHMYDKFKMSSYKKIVNILKAKALS